MMYHSKYAKGAKRVDLGLYTPINYTGTESMAFVVNAREGSTYLLYRDFL